MTARRNKYNKVSVINKMWNMKRIAPLFVFIILVFTALQSKAQVTDDIFRVLSDANSARVVALGGMPLPVHDGDLQTAVFNPSAISPEMNNQIALSYVGDFNVGTNYATVQYSRTFEKLGSFAASVQYYNYGNMPYASESGYVDGNTFSVSDYAITLGWGRELSDKWSIGANLKYAGLQYESYHGGALAVDVAATYWSYTNWAFTLAARNIGMQLYNDFDNRNVKLPFSVDFMASKKLDHLPLTIYLAFDDIQQWNKIHTDTLVSPNYNPTTGQYEEPSNTAKFFTNLACHLVVGGELELGKNLVLRASYNYGTSYNMGVPQKRTLVGFSAGFGVKIKMFEIDYTRSRNNIVGSPNFLTIRIDLNKFK